MARIPYAELNGSEEVSVLSTAIAKDRGGRVPTLYEMLLNSPPVANGWLQLLTAIQQLCHLKSRYREMVIIRVAVDNNAPVEAKGHIPHALKAGMNQAEVDALWDWEKSSLFDEVDRAVLAYTDAMTNDIHVPDETFSEVRKHFNDRQITELTATVASYNLVSRFLVALQVDYNRIPSDFSLSRKQPY